ncbi:hypothetical protein EKN52_14700 [Enterobacter roggenkampii]|nr:hypothetical protein EKN52_14700 [Enterobacter roggenkampii]
MAHVPQRSEDSLHYFFQIQRVAGMCKPVVYDSQRRFTSVAIRCDTSEETRMQQREHSTENGPRTFDVIVADQNALPVVVNGGADRQTVEKR